MSNLANSLLSLARYQKGNNFSFTQINLGDVVETVYKKVKPLAEKKKIDQQKDVKQMTIAGVEGELEKLVTILLDNAVKYTPEKGKISLTVKDIGKYALIEVKDSGIGIPQEDLPYIFERFYRVDTSRSKLKVEGTGLGLFMAKEIVKLHKGFIDAKSSPGKGTTITVRLPISHS